MILTLIRCLFQYALISRELPEKWNKGTYTSETSQYETREKDNYGYFTFLLCLQWYHSLRYAPFGNKYVFYSIRRHTRDRSENNYNHKYGLYDYRRAAACKIVESFPGRIPQSGSCRR